MINQLDKVLRKLLIYALPIKNGEVEIVFEQPKREWSARLNRPTLNLFLYDVHENNVLREPEWEIKRTENGSVVRQRKPVRLDVHYMLTVWAATPDDEHSLLAQALRVLFRFPFLPPPEDKQKEEDKLFWQEMGEAWPEILQHQPAPIPIRVAQAEGLRNPAEIWSALDNELRPAIACVITLAINPYEPETTPLVHTRELYFDQAVWRPQPGQLVEVEAEDRTGADRGDRFWMVGGTIHGSELLKNVRLTLVERGQDIPVQADGRFIIGNLAQGAYTLQVEAKGRQPRQHPITVPAKNYDIQL